METNRQGLWIVLVLLIVIFSQLCIQVEARYIVLDRDVLLWDQQTVIRLRLHRLVESGLTAYEQFVV